MSGSLIITTEELGMGFSQYYGLGRALKLSRETINLLHTWSIECESCGRLFSPKLNAPKRTSIRCVTCRRIWRKEYKRYWMKINKGYGSSKKPYKLFITGSYIV